MKLLAIIVSIVIFTSCKSDDNRIAVSITNFELGECFSVTSLKGSEIIITNQDDYKEFEESIRRHFNPQCDNVNLPTIDFKISFFIGKYTETKGCEANYVREVFYDNTTDSYDYNITVSPSGNCDILISSFNCAIVTKLSESASVNFVVK